MILETTKSRSVWRLYIFFAGIVVGLCILMFTMAVRQLVQVQEWTEKMAQGSTRVVRIPAPRGNILDRNGTILVDNRPSYNVALYLDEFGAGHRPKRLLAAVSNSVAMLRQRMKMPVKINDRVVLTHYDRRGPLPLTVWNDLSPAALAAFEERSPWMKGVDLQVEPVRVYPYGKLASHILGYVGRPESSKQEAEMGWDTDTVGRRAFSQLSVIGKSGIELSMDKELQGMPGIRILKLNARGLVDCQISQAQPTPGNSVVLSLDRDIQEIVEECFIGFRGACVILDPSNGDVLAMASVPSYDPNLFIPAIRKSDWNQLIKDEQKPMINRAIQGTYCPGSTFKVIVSLAGLEAGIIDQKTNFECPGRFFLGPIEFKCWNTGGHGDMHLREAITLSCNVYFYNLGLRLGGPRLWAMAEAFGLGQKTGIQLDHEEPGILPTEQWKKANINARERWTSGDSVNMSIGQGFLNVTPLQMAMVASTMANSGRVFKPRLVQRVISPEGDTVMEFEPGTFGDVPVTPEHMRMVREAMLNVVVAGTGRSAGQEKVKVAGKTGSAQFKERDKSTGEWIKQTRAWMISFAPYDNPRYAMALIAEGGESGGHTAGPIVGKIYRKIFQLEADRKNNKSRSSGRPVAVAAVPVSEKIAGFEGEVSGELLGSEHAPEAIPVPSVLQDDMEDEPPPTSVHAEKVRLP